jgi:hypothetical protein
MALLQFFWRGLPAYVWVGVAYAVVVVGAPVSGQNTVALERYLASPLFSVPLLNSGTFIVSFNAIFIVAAFVAVWIEVIRATSIRNRAGNDWMSLVATFVAILVFAGAAPFGTMAFMVVPLAGFGDLLLDRLVGQAVARRDFAVG